MTVSPLPAQAQCRTGVTARKSIDLFEGSGAAEDASEPPDFPPTTVEEIGEMTPEQGIPADGTRIGHRLPHPASSAAPGTGVPGFVVAEEFWGPIEADDIVPTAEHTAPVIPASSTAPTPEATIIQPAWDEPHGGTPGYWTRRRLRRWQTGILR
ncbi:hypothetical protein [Nocardia bovistercoris]|uniref:Uncharacterized protein n=1 Tax=Nocardia bovistercoris TaxID=2785916 RepID=A0A931I799_9NOCA|nr:hypothetical protein [Nocardia bovistercoris]MBH0775556.1 hypothetical protein [Nocardia bovistercoris]